MRHCERYLAHLLRKNKSVTGVLAELATLHPATLRGRYGRQGWSACPSTETRCARRRGRGRDGHRRGARHGKGEKPVIESGMKRRGATAKASAAETKGACQRNSRHSISSRDRVLRGKVATVGKGRPSVLRPLCSTGRNLLNFGDGLAAQRARQPRGDGMAMTFCRMWLVMPSGLRMWSSGSTSRAWPDGDWRCLRHTSKGKFSLALYLTFYAHPQWRYCPSDNKFIFPLSCQATPTS
jgi:hypothetical protein